MTDFQLIPLGTSPAWYNPGEAASGFLLEAGGGRVLVDCGSGVVSRYLEMAGNPARRLDAIVITHLHPDHCFDLVPLKYAMEYGQLAHWGRPQLWLPPGGQERLRRLTSAWDGGDSFFADSFDVREYSPHESFTVAEFEVSAMEVPHFIECFALRFDHGSGSFAYSADLGPYPELARLVDGVDVFLCEATASEGEGGGTDRGHLTPEEAGEIAQLGNVRSLLLTHIPHEKGPEFALRAAARTFSGPIELARSGHRYVMKAHLAKVG